MSVLARSTRSGKISERQFEKLYAARVWGERNDCDELTITDKRRGYVIAKYVRIGCVLKKVGKNAGGDHDGRTVQAD